MQQESIPGNRPVQQFVSDSKFPGKNVRTASIHCKMREREERIEPKSVIRHAVSVSDWENEASGHLARFCPHPVSRYAFG